MKTVCKKGCHKISGRCEEKKVIPTYTHHLFEPWFSLISDGLKSVRAQLNKGPFVEMRVGETVEWVNEDFGRRTVLTEIIEKHEYKTFYEFLSKEGLYKCFPLPEIKTIEDGLSILYKYYTKEDEAQYGVVSVLLRVLD